MILDFDRVKHKYRKIIRKIYEEALKETNNDLPNVWLTVSFVKKERIRDLNRMYRKVDRFTDVLSFPMLDIVYPQTLKDYQNEYSPDGNLYLGDVVICPKVAKWQAKLYDHSKKREIAFLALHGLLHILGYDHINSDEEAIMMDTSEKILEKAGLKRR